MSEEMMDQVSVLVVDDALIMRNIIGNNLKNMGYDQIDYAENGQIAIDKINVALNEKKPFSVIFLDWNMPVLPGIEVLKYVRSKSELGHVWVIMVTAENETQHKELAEKEGVDYFVTKPFDKNKLSAIAQSLFSKPRSKK